MQLLQTSYIKPGHRTESYRKKKQSLFFIKEKSCFRSFTGKLFCFADPKPLHYYPSDPVFSPDTIWWMQNCFSHIRAYSGSKAQWLLGLILALLCASWSGAPGFPALLACTIDAEWCWHPAQGASMFPAANPNVNPPGCTHWVTVSRTLWLPPPLLCNCTN